MHAVMVCVSYVVCLAVIASGWILFPQVCIVCCECLRVSPSCSIVRVRRAQVMATSDSNLLARSRACGVVFQNRGSRPGQEGFQGDLNAIVIAAVRAAISCFVLSLKDCFDAFRVTLRTCVCLCGAKIVPCLACTVLHLGILCAVHAGHRRVSGVIVGTC